MIKVLLLSLLTAAVFIVYSNTLGVPFVFDDRPNIEDNPHIRLTKLNLASLKSAGFESPNSRRPVANISFGLNYYFEGYALRGFHLVNILLHIITGLLLYVFLTTTLALQSLKKEYGSLQWLPLAASSIWLIHPLNTQSVTYVVQRMNILASLFYILTLLLYARGRMAKGAQRTWLFGGCLSAFLLAIGSKETAATLPVFLFLYEWYFFQNLRSSWLKQSLSAIVATAMLVILISFVFLGPNPVADILAGYQARSFTLLQRLFTESRVVVFYLSLLLLPHPGRLNLDHSLPHSLSALTPASTFFSMTIIAGLVVLAIITARRDRLLSFCLLWFLGNLLIESSIIGLELVFEHRTYLPAMLLWLLAVLLANRYIVPLCPKLVLLGMVLTTCAFWTYERNSIWINETTLWSDCAKKSPLKARPHYNLGNLLFTQGKLASAAISFQKAVQINPDDARTHGNLGTTFHRLGRLLEAVFHYRQALHLQPNYVPVRFHLAGALQDIGKINEAIIHLKEANRLQPDNIEIQDRLEAAINYEAALKKRRPTGAPLKER